jgi:tetratricopeptide (TPR) repeat protein
MIYYYKKNYTIANKYFKKIISLYPFGYDALLMYAWTNFQLGKTGEAKIMFNKVLLLSPYDTSALEGLGLIK